VRVLDAARRALNHLQWARSVTRGPTTSFANLVGVNSRTSTTRKSSNSGSLLATRDAAYQGAGAGAAGGRQLIAMLLPETSPMLMTVPNTGVMCVPVIAVPMPDFPAGSGGGRHSQEHQKR